ncbi:MAG: hypothetical protein KQH83_11410 [Actinobacteria bacterium]|nr:hypothetical protein [Actinomycetota bacterium]
MGAREKMSGRMRPFLEDGERIMRVFPASGGLHPLFAIVTMLGGLGLSNVSTVAWPIGLGVIFVGIALVSATGNLVVAVTNRGVVIAEAGLLMALSPKRLRARLPEGTRIGPALRGLLWLKMSGLSQAAGAPIRVHLRFKADAVAGEPRAPG